MSVQAITWAFQQEITPAGLKFVLVTLANYASDDGYCYPSQRTLARLTGQSLRAVNAHLATLEERGYIVRAHRFRDDGGQTSDGFYLHTPLHDLHTPPATTAYPPVQNLHTPHATAAPDTKEDTLVDTKEDREIAPTVLRIRERDAARLKRRR